MLSNEIAALFGADIEVVSVVVVVVVAFVLWRWLRF